MFAICIEASHSKGMGHLFRMLNFTTYLDKQNEKFVFFINDDSKTKQILKNYNINYTFKLHFIFIFKLFYIIIC